LNMCEFNVILNGKTVFKDAIYAKMDGNKLIVKDVLGKSREFENCKIIEVDVNSTRMVLSSSKA
jgi:predicted RNA-binding protein